MGNLGVSKKQDTGNVYFAPGIVKSITKSQSIEIDSHTGLDKDVYNVTLKDGTRLSYRKQKGSNLAKVVSSNGVIYFKGFDGIEVAETPKNDRYEFHGCRGRVDLYAGEYSKDYDSVVTKPRTFQSGVVQESSMWIIKDKNAKIKYTGDVDIWDVWKQRQRERSGK